MYIATVNHDHKVKSATISGIKRRASRVANRDYNPVDIMYVTDDGSPGSPLQGRTVRYTRINQKSPDGNIKRGTWN